LVIIVCSLTHSPLSVDISSLPTCHLTALLFASIVH